jgi:hypothetical protein
MAGISIDEGDKMRVLMVDEFVGHYIKVRDKKDSV